MKEQEQNLMRQMVLQQTEFKRFIDEYQACHNNHDELRNLPIDNGKVSFNA